MRKIIAIVVLVLIAGSTWLLMRPQPFGAPATTMRRAASVEAAASAAPNADQPPARDAAPALPRPASTQVTDETWALRPVDGVLTERYDELAAAARAGDAEIAMDLYGNLADCLEMFGPEPSDVAINAQLMIETPDLVGADRMAKLDAPGAERYRKQFERLGPGAVRCRGLTAAQIATQLEWFDLAARLGNVHARRTYIPVMTPDHAAALKDPRAVQRWKDTGYAYLDQLANAGDRHAMSELAFQLYHGAVFERDRARALAVLTVAYERAPGSAYLAPRLARWRGELTAQEVERAERLAAELRSRCCR